MCEHAMLHHRHARLTPLLPLGRLGVRGGLRARVDGLLVLRVGRPFLLAVFRLRILVAHPSTVRPHEWPLPLVTAENLKPPYTTAAACRLLNSRSPNWPALLSPQQ